MLSFEDGDPGSTGDVQARLLGIADIVAMQEVGGVARELAPRSNAEGDAIGVDVVSGLLDDDGEARRDSNIGN